MRPRSNADVQRDAELRRTLARPSTRELSRRYVLLIAILLAMMSGQAAQAQQVSYVAATGAKDDKKKQVVLTIPNAVQLEDLLLVTVIVRPGVGIIPAQAGWTMLRKDSGVDASQFTFYRFAGAADAGMQQIFDFDLGGLKDSEGAAGMLVFRGVDLSNPIEATSGATYGFGDAEECVIGGKKDKIDPIQAPRLQNPDGTQYLASAGAMLVGLFSSGQDGTKVTEPPLVTTTPSCTQDPLGTPSWVETIQQKSGGGGKGFTLEGSYQPTVCGAGGAGCTGTRTAYATNNQKNASIAQLFALRPRVLLDHYRVQNNAAGVNCQAESITVSAHDAGHNPVVLNTSTTITLTAAYVSGAGGGRRGDWSIVSGGGVLDNGAADDGVATYTFAAGGESSIVLALKDTWAQTVNIAVSDGSATDVSGTASADAGYDQNLTFNAAGFRFIDIGNNLIPNQVAGVSSAPLLLQAIQSGACAPTGACTGVCTAPPGFASGSSVTIELASECVNPLACQAGQQVRITNNGTSTIAANNAGAVGSYTAKSLLFGANGTASFTLNDPDVGAIRLHARYSIPLGTGAASANTMTGASNAFVVKPYSFVVSNVRRTADSFANPGAANAAGPVFIAAGEDFSATVTAVNAAANPTPNYGKEIVAEGARLLPTLVGGLGLTQNPAITNNTAFGGFNAGAASASIFSWGEVGIITLSAGVADGDYLGAGEAAVFTQSGNVGRFTPHHFALAGAVVTNRVARACAPASSFTYLGEGIGLQFSLTARNKAAAPTQNYTSGNAFAKLPTTPGALPPALPTLGYGVRDVASATDLTGRLDLSTINALTWNAGQAFVDTRIAVNRAAIPDGPFADVRIGIAPRDGDGVGMRSGDLNLDVDGVGGTDHAQLNGGGVPLRYGRLRVFNAVGSQLIDLPVPLEAQYYNGVGFITNAADSCTALAKSSVIFTNFQRNLSACETQAQTPGSALLLQNGKARLILTKPGSGADGNAGSVDLKPRLSTTETGNTCVSATAAGATNANLPYLQFNWGGAVTYDQNPAATASFGQARATQELIYFRENY